LTVLSQHNMGSILLGMSPCLHPDPPLVLDTGLQGLDNLLDIILIVQPIHQLLLPIRLPLRRTLLHHLPTRQLHQHTRLHRLPTRRHLLLIHLHHLPILQHLLPTLQHLLPTHQLHRPIPQHPQLIHLHPLPTRRHLLLIHLHHLPILLPLQHTHQLHLLTPPPPLHTRLHHQPLVRQVQPTVLQKRLHLAVQNGLLPTVLIPLLQHHLMIIQRKRNRRICFY
jgi:hypothetical protein